MQTTNQEEKQREAGPEEAKGRAKLSPVIQIDEGEDSGAPGRSGSQHGRRDVERHAGYRSRSSLPCRAVRTDGGPQGYPSGFLPTAVAHESWRSDVESAEAAHTAV
jgi:hypothetical protein